MWTGLEANVQGIGQKIHLKNRFRCNFLLNSSCFAKWCNLWMKQEELRRKLHRKQFFNGFVGQYLAHLPLNLWIKHFLGHFWTVKYFQIVWCLKWYEFERKIYFNHSQMGLTKDLTKTQLLTFFWYLTINFFFLIVK